MKFGKSLATYTFVFLMGLFLCAPCLVFGGGSPGGGGVSGTSVTGPKLKGVLIVGWKYVETIDETDFGITEAFLKVNDKLYTGITTSPAGLGLDPEPNFLATTAVDISGSRNDPPEDGWRLPEKIAADNDLPINRIPIIPDERNVHNFRMLVAVDQIPNPPYQPLDTYRHILYCEVDIQFFH